MNTLTNKSNLTHIKKSIVPLQWDYNVLVFKTRATEIKRMIRLACTIKWINKEYILPQIGGSLRRKRREKIDYRSRMM